MEYSETKNESAPVIEVEDFSVSFTTYDGEVKALTNINFTLEEGEILGIIGESGSGKSTLALSLMSLLPENANVNGSVKYEGEVITDGNNSGRAYQKLTKRSRKVLDSRLSSIRWKDISMVFQGAMNSLNPVYTVRKQIAEVFKIHTDYPVTDINEKIEQISRISGFNLKYLDSYPHELSGGMKQRAVLAMAIALDPVLIIADEPTTGLDVITQAKIIKELRKLKDEGIIKSMVIISHDVGVVSQLADRVAVLYAGKIMEVGKPADIYLNPSNPYSKALIESYPSMRSVKKRVSGIPGSVPNLFNLKDECYFAERCSYADDICFKEVPPTVDLGNGHRSMCHFATNFRNRETKEVLVEDRETEADPDNQRSFVKHRLIEANNLTKYFNLVSSSVASLLTRSGNRIVHAVDHVTFSTDTGEIIGVVGESGSGKSTLGRTLLLSYKPTGGETLYNLMEKQDGKDSDGTDAVTDRFVDISKLRERDANYREFRKKVQLIFQDPYDSLNPKMSIFDIVAEPANAHRTAANYDELVDQVSNVLETTNLKPATNYVNRYPHELSGGERQRVSIARSLILRPDFLVADEPISMLDVSIRANIMNLLIKLKDEFNMTILYISHDIASARYVSDKLAVMYLGELLEVGPADDVINNPLHPYTKALIQAVPIPDPSWSSQDLKIVGEIGNSVDVPPGCRFYSRCVFRKDVCKSEKPPVKKNGNSSYMCHFEQNELKEEDIYDGDFPDSESSTDDPGEETTADESTTDYN